MNETSKTLVSKVVMVLVVLTMGIFFQACGPDDEPAEPVKTVNKDLLENKQWYYEGSRFHYF